MQETQRCRFDPCIRKIPWRRKWQSAPIFLPGKFHGQKTLVGSSLWDYKLDTSEHTHTHTHTHTRTHTHTLVLQLFSVWKDPVLKSRRSNKRTSIQERGDLTANTIGWVRSKEEKHIEPSEEMVTSGRMEGQTSRKGPLDSDKVKK